MATLGYLVVISTVALRPEVTMILGLEKMRASPVDSSARKVRYISEKSKVPVKWVILPLEPVLPESAVEV